jgi:DNA repair protein RadA/Sms
MAARCIACGTEARAPLEHCPTCGGFRTVLRLPKSEDGGVLVAARATPLDRVRATRRRPIPTGVRELDEALAGERGGGLPLGSITLLYGAPGTRKTTRAAAAASAIGRATRRHALYLSSEMPVVMVRDAAQRGGALLAHLFAIHTDDVELALTEIDRLQPAAVVWDSLPHFGGADAGSDATILRVATAARRAGLRHGAATLLIGHVTKEGELAGPARLPHLVDCVIEVTQTRVRVTKSRFGPLREVVLSGSDT